MEQRESRRFRLEQAVRLSADRDSEEEYLSAEIVDLSASGVGILSDSPVPVLSPMFLMFGPRDGDSSHGLVRCEGYAARSDSVGDRYRIGVKLTNIDPASTAAFQAYLEALASGSEALPASGS